MHCYFVSSLLSVFVVLCPTLLIAQNMGEKFVFDNGEGQTMPYRLLGPSTTQAGTEYPLIIFMHGSGERGTNNTIQMSAHIGGLRDATQTQEFASYLVAPQLPSGGTNWNSDQPYDLTMEIIESLQKDLPIDSGRIYLTGLSLGGFGTMDYLATFPDTFAAGVPMSGGGPTVAADVVKDVPTWFFHGDMDSAVDVDASRQMYNAMNEQGGAPLLTEIQRGGHVIWAPIYSDWTTEEHGLYDWMFAQSLPSPDTDILVPFESDWRYLDDGSDQGVAWQAAGFDDASWKVGQGEFGYKDGDENTILNCGPDPRCRNDAFATTYFRTTFEFDSTSLIKSLEGQVLRDDAAAVYINGHEVFRDPGLVADAPFDTYSSTSTENSSAGFVIDPTIILDGENVLAVEVHRATRTEDLSFDMRLAVRTIPEPSTAHLFAMSFIALCYFAKSGRVRA